MKDEVDINTNYAAFRLEHSYATYILDHVATVYINERKPLCT